MRLHGPVRRANVQVSAMLVVAEGFEAQTLFLHLALLSPKTDQATIVDGDQEGRGVRGFARRSRFLTWFCHPTDAERAAAKQQQPFRT